MHHMSIKGRLIAALAVFITAFTLFGLFTIAKVSKLENIADKVYEDHLKVSYAAMEAQVDIANVQKRIRDIMVIAGVEEVKKFESDISALEGEISRKLNDIKLYSSGELTIEVERKVRESFIKWSENNHLIIKEYFYGEKQTALEAIHGYNSALIDSLDQYLTKIDTNAKLEAEQQIKKVNGFPIYLEKLIIALIVGLNLFLILFFSLVIRSILKSIEKLQDSMNESATTGVLKDVVLDGNNEIAGIANYYNVLIQKLRNQFWLKDGQNSLNQEISVSSDLSDMAKRSLDFIIKTLDIARGALYIYNEDNKHLEIHASYAFTEREQKIGGYALGEGIIGESGLKKDPIYIENIKAFKDNEASGTAQKSPMNVYVFPLIFEGNMRGVIELASIEPFDELKREFLKEAGAIIAANVYSEAQNQKAKRLLEISEKAQMEANYNASQLLNINQMLEEQQLRLQQQSEELQHTNIQLEEHQLLMEEQTDLLNIRNMQLESSKIELLKHSKELETANKYKSQFLANMSHELRTPLNSIILLSRLLLKNDRGALDKIHVEKLDVIYNSGQELLRLINDILDLSKIEAGKMNVDNKEFDTKSLLMEAKRMFEEAAQEKDIKLICKDFVNSKIYGDYNKISQIIRNLLSNAIKFTNKGTVCFEIKQGENQDIHMIIADTGIGVSKENLKYIFEEFHQGDGSISRNFGGTGLGLSISKKLAEVINGEILVQSEEGKGSSFTLLLKNAAVSIKMLQNAEEAAVSIDNSNLQQKDEAALFLLKLKKNRKKPYYHVSEANNESNLILKDKRILIADDDPRNIFVLASALEDFGAEILEAENGKMALELLEYQKIDLILMDIMMPVMDGYQVIKAIRDSKTHGSIPIIAVTAKSLKNDREKCLRAGADDYISKPVDYDTLMKSIMEWIEK